MDGLVIRKANSADARDICELSAELGYPSPLDAMQRRIDVLASLADHAVYVATVGGEMAGWIHVAIVHRLQAESRAEIGGLVVGAQARSKGIGRELVARAEEWALQQGANSVAVRSQIARQDAHRFYLREGYSQTKTSAVLTKLFTCRAVIYVLHNI
jgi:GNAT superfamily N-acetyltransferase